MGLHIDLEGIYFRNLELRNDASGKYAVKNGLLINTGDNFTKKEIAQKKQENIRKYGLSTEYYMSLKPPKAKTKEWLKVLTIEQILRDRSRFSVS